MRGKREKMNHPTLHTSPCHHIVTINHSHGKGTVNGEMERGVVNQRGSKLTILLRCFAILLPACNMSKMMIAPAAATSLLVQ